jgi:acyl transferase domain-containing protein/NAD(P)-dependent dehydrogenase (short-subunit alcohol dehydrogenase family)
VNSFGYGGTNAHVLLGPPPASANDAAAQRSHLTADAVPRVLPLSAESEAGLRAVAQLYADLLADPNGPPLDDVIYSAAVHRTHLTSRLAVAGRDKQSILGKLRMFLSAASGEGIHAGKAAARAGRGTVFVFTGMGPQWWAMGQELYRSEPVYRRAADEIDAAFVAVAGFSILAEMLRDEASSRITQTQFAQPANFLLQVALTRMLAAAGIRPDAIVGHSVGEVSAAHVAGVLSLHDAVTVSYHRSRLQKTAAGTGSMLAVGLSDEIISPLLEGFAGRVSIAAVNSPAATTLAGNTEALAELAAAFTAEGVFNKMLDVEVPYHSPMMESLEAPVLEHLAALQPALPTMPLYSTVTGARVTGIAYDAAYWYANIRQPVFFAQAIGALLADGFETFIEVGPHPVLSSSLKEIFRDRQIEARQIETLRRNKPEAPAIAAAAMALYLSGARLHWRTRCAGGRFVRLPNYPWQREVLWTEAREARADRLADLGDSLLGSKLETLAPTWQGEFNEHTMPYLPDHRIDDLVVVPAAAYLETFLALHDQVMGGPAAAGGGAVLRQVSFSQALIANGNERTRLTAEYDPARRSARLASRKGGEAATWSTHAEACLYQHDDAPAGSLDLAALQMQCDETVDPAALYASLAQRGLNYGPRFQTIVALHRRDGAVLARLRATAPLEAEPVSCRVHPTLLDGCFQAMITAIDPGASAGGFVPVGIRELQLHREFPAEIWCYGRLTAASARFVECDFEVCDLGGQILAAIKGLSCQAIAGDRRDADPARLAARGYEYRWSEAPAHGATVRAGRWLIIGDDADVGQDLAAALRTRGVADVLVAGTGTTVSEIDGRLAVVEPQEGMADLHRLIDGLDGVALLHGCDIGPGTFDPVGLAAAQKIVCVLQGLARLRHASPRVYVVTRNAHRVTSSQGWINPASASLVGTTRVAFNELGALRCTSIDLCDALLDGSTEALASELVGDFVEDEIALCPQGRFVSELVRSDRMVAADLTQLDMGGEDAFVLAEAPRRESAPVFRQIPRPTIAEGEVLIRVHAVAGSRAFLAAHDAEAGMPEALVCGEVREGGRTGALVCGMARGALASHVTLPADSVIAVPNGLNIAAPHLVTNLHLQARALLAVRQARIGRGQLVLVYADRMGLAICQAAKSRAATVIAVRDASLPDNPRGFGADAVVCGAGEIAVAVAHLSRGRGAAVLAVPLPEWQRVFDLSSLAAGGCLIDTSTDLVAGLSNTPITGSVVRVAAPQTPAAMLFSLNVTMRKLADGGFRVIPHGTVAAGQVGSAWPDAAILMHEPGTDMTVRRLATLPIGPDRTYLISGGFGGFGTEVARWLVAQGARYIALIGRRGAADLTARGLVHELEDAGARVAVLATDIGEADALHTALTDLAKTMPPISGVIHSAAVLADATFADMTDDAFRRAMLPKAMGAWNLHMETAHLPLDFFVMFSSISGLVGNSGQTNYAAANCYLDALAEHRRALGQPATSIAWGAIADVGLVSRSATVQKHLEYTGLVGMKVADALTALGVILTRDLTQICYAEADWQQWGRHEPTGGKSPRFAPLVGAAEAGSDAGGGEKFRAQLIELSAADRQMVTAYMLAELFGPELRLAADEIDIHKPFNRIGIDSLMATTLQLSMEAAMGVRISAFELVGEANLAELALKCLAQLDLPDAAAPVAVKAA